MDSSVLFAGFNQDAECFSIGLESGFKIFTTDPYKNTFSREFDGGIAIVEMLYRSNIIAIVGGGSSPMYNPNKVMLWDDNQSKCIGELKFKSPVKGVKMSRESIAVVLEDRIYVYQLVDLVMKDAIETSPNPDGICVMKNQVLICPDQKQGTVRINQYERNLVNTVEAHEGAIQCLALNDDSSLMATASDRGTLIRIFDTATGNKVQEVRRGADPARIFSIAFDQKSERLAVTSDKGTCHCYYMNSEESAAGKEKKENTKGWLGFLSPAVSYFGSEWSFASFKFDDSGAPARTHCAFRGEDKLVLISEKGKYWKLAISKEELTCEEVTETT